MELEHTVDNITEYAFEALCDENKKVIFLTGKAGTGKSTLVRRYVKYCEVNKIKVAVLASTGIAAMNIGGSTIHSFFRFDVNTSFPPRETRNNIILNELLQTVDVIIIDEISMVRADLLDRVNAQLKYSCNYGSYEPFAGKKIILVGDLNQLAPVITDNEKEIFSSFYKTEYFFSSKVFNTLLAHQFEMIELTKIYRQSDEKFISVLNKVRDGIMDSAVNKMLSERVFKSDTDFYTHLARTKCINLCTANYQAIALNELMLNNLDKINGYKSELHTFLGVYTKYTNDETQLISESNLPALSKLDLKVGAKVILTKNDKNEGYVNGTMGYIKEINADEQYITVIEADTDKEFKVERYTWEGFTYSSKDGEIVKDLAWSYTQYPIKLAWAITVHKSQGLTFDEVIIDSTKPFRNNGQFYTALSRCRTIEGISIKGSIRGSDAKVSLDVENFMLAQRKIFELA